MPIRITGLNSGLDTEALVSELVSAYRLKTQKYTKAQTKLSWKQDAWKSLNTKISSFFSSIRSLKYSSAYNTKKATSSDSTKATVSAASSAVNGTYSLEVKQVATTSYLTGGQLDSSTTSSSTLGSLGYTGSGSITVKTGDGTQTDISVTSSTTISDFVTSLQNAGLSASYDSANQRIFVSSKASGAGNDFTLTGNNEAGNEALSALGLLVTDDLKQSYVDNYARYALNEDGNLYFDLDSDGNLQYNADGTVKVNGTYDAEKTKENITTAKESLIAASTTITKNKALIEYANAYQTVNSADADTGSDEYAAAQAVLDKYDADEAILTNDEKKEIQDAYTVSNDLTSYVAGKQAEIDESQAKIDANSLLANSSAESFASKVDNAAAVLDGTQDLADGGTGAVRIYGQDSVISLNGATYTSSSNEFTVNGLSITALAVTSDAMTVTVANDVDGLYDKIKSFIGQYNDLINEMTSLYNADSASGYEPLTSEEKDALSDTEVEEWEKKIKDSLLRRDDSLDSIMNSMKTAMFSSFTINGKSYSLSSFGISTIGVLNAEENEENAFHIDGDSDDSYTSANTDKLLAALKEDPDTVAEFFKQLVTGLYDAIDAKMSSTELSSYGKVYNDKEMAQEYSDYTTTISKWEEKLADLEDSYYQKFAAMESALATLQSQQSSLASLLGG